MLAWLFLFVSLVGAAGTVAALVPARRLGVFVVPYFFASWLTGELAMHHLVWQAVATITFVALGALQQWPGVVALAVTVASWIGLVAVQRRAGLAADAFAQALRAGLGHAHPAPIVHPQVSARRVVRPFKMRDAAVQRVRNLSYGPAGKRNLLDVYRHRSAPQGCPTLLQIHGGAWTIGDKDQQGLPLMNRLAARGWVCVAPNYRLSPKATFPDHLVDVKRALAWIREHGAAYGADPRFVVVTGGSAGGHLAALLALTANDPAYQPGFEGIDTSVSVCVPFYGVYDFLDRHGVRGSQSMAPFLQRVVMKCSPHEYRTLWDNASPISRVHADAPPFFVIHGTHDALAYVEDARLFVQALRAVSRNPVVYAEIPGAQHAFEIFHSVRCAAAVDAVGAFLEYVRASLAHQHGEGPALSAGTPRPAAAGA
jgi:acetyl esterase/lipase